MTSLTPSTTIVSGTPRWAVRAAYAAVACVVPSALWRAAVSLGVPLGWSEHQLRLQQIPGPGTLYVIALSVLSLAAAALTLGLVQRWGEVVPPAVLLFGGRRVPALPVIAAAVLGAVTVIAIGAMSVVSWSKVSGFRRQPRLGMGAADDRLLPTSAGLGTTTARRDLGLLASPIEPTHGRGWLMMGRTCGLAVRAFHCSSGQVAGCLRSAQERPYQHVSANHRDTLVRFGIVSPSQAKTPLGRFRGAKGMHWLR